jgi:mevalonate kinase
VAFGHGKVILLGEHGVVYGRPALAASLARGVHARAEPADRDRLVVEPWDVSVEPDASSEGPLARGLAAVLDQYEQPRAPLRIEAQVDLPGSAGLGCSAALGVAVLGAVDEHLGLHRSREEKAEASFHWERVFHGTPSGVDSAMASGAGMAVFHKGEPLEPVHPSSPLTLVIGHSGEPGSTKEMVDAVARQRERAPERVDQTFDGMASLVRNARLAAVAGDLQGFGKLMDLNQALLNSLMVSTTRLEDLCNAARAAGATGAKLTGAGGGGCMIALAEDRGAAERIVRSLEDIGAEAFIVEAGA